MDSTFPCPSDIIEVLWIVNDHQPFWWRAIVLYINTIRKGKKISKVLLLYGPGPKVPNHSHYFAFFYSEMTIFDSNQPL